ncbi:N-acetylmuramoyl-L-alanine amidase [Buchnera aphidicola]|uniref:N-acetylmuramoyl-L-alanine amidase n=1 Tax=Buchnera aphidicola TaxID=9 RepID=UPI001D0366B5|nr:N-acetylmuramoyl-L-alanine amidase [Buchnera aphidicola]
MDAGHGGHDPGAVNVKGTQEKKINIEIALRLKKLLNNDSIFYTILTRNNDSFLSLKKRKQFLKKHHVNLLISIHADSSKKQYVSGASIWMVSRTRINREINNYLKKKSTMFLSKNIEYIFNENKYDFFLKKTILDLQFNNCQKIALDLSKEILKQLKKNIKLNKIYPNYGSLGILSSINTPSILIETGFITNFLEEKKLRTADHQNKIANSIYLALKNYFNNSF